MTAKTTVEKFFESWVSSEVHNIPGLSDGEGLEREVARLRGRLVAAAAASGITVEQLDEAAGDIDDYLTNAYENVHDPELGFKDAERS